MSILHTFSIKSGRLVELTFSSGARRRNIVASGRKNRQAKSRILTLAGVLTMAYLAICGKLVYFDSQPAVDTANIPSGPVIAWRPDIVDRNGELLATDIRTVSMFAEPFHIVDVDEAVEKLSTLFPDLDKKTLYQKLSDKRSHFAWLRRQLTPKQQNEVLGLGIPAIGFRPEVKRFYPGGRTAAHILGYVDIDNHGVAGIEKYLDGQGLSDLTSAGMTSRDSLQPVHLSIDLRVQNIVHDVVSDAIGQYQAQSAGAVILDIHTGEVLAMASAPDFDPNDPQADIKGWLNRMSDGTDEMGSVFKTFSIAMAIDTGTVKLTDTFDASAPLHYGGFTIHDDRDVPRRWLTVPEIFRYSSNIGTAKIMDKVGMDVQKTYLTRFGLLSRMQTELPEVKAPSQPKVWKKINSITIAFGHGVATTPMQTAVAGAALIDGGELIEPTFLPRTREEAEKTEKMVVKKSTSDVIRYLFKLNGEQGTGKTADVPGFHVGGKTGTANKVINGVYSHKLSFNSFLAAFPMENPRYVVLSFIDQPLTGLHNLNLAAETAAPMVHDIVSRAAPLLGVEPNFGQNLLTAY
ncbi:penicillin-binding protein 2 [Agrobacterium rhizogenes]|uniref:Cell division penicillin-binding protein n=1 Tax=Rhizobium rhizogenes (strain K84 / ATCC BAA-868) TaxID=311403 RepID=B9JLC4_RHIR8|nr:penicillin-binding protein 2 [Rhizobium rhizogenes]ACM28623.1 cell division penicillin-binding protein [Rhizobium rhizogenes K84]KAA6488040.1 penicillin-binding protein 2 [Agrobacterium sp. ICMP 7243]OCI95921.1 cell division protein [Agrobacterium sp. 13-626]OCJ20405.1 cell division protein [Agrobacterium sp. B131/95]OCJ23259.1 cell division protein [Agrobacterium sp. B133/95]